MRRQRGRIAWLSLLIVLVAALVGGCGGAAPSAGEKPPVTAEPSQGNDGGEPDPVPHGGPTVQPGAGPPEPVVLDEAQRQALLDRQREFLRAGELVYRPPSPMRVGEWRRVVVRVSGDTPPPGFTEGLPGTGPVESRAVVVGSNLVAELGGTDFEVLRVGGDDGSRALLTGRFAEWQWDVRPLRSGTLRLDLVLFVRLRDGASPVDVRTFVEPVQVQVNPGYTVKQWLGAHWAATGLTVPVILTGIAAAVRWRNRGGRSRPPSRIADSTAARSTGTARAPRRRKRVKAEAPAKTRGERRRPRRKR